MDGLGLLMDQHSVLCFSTNIGEHHRSVSVCPLSEFPWIHVAFLLDAAGIVFPQKDHTFQNGS